MKATKQQAFSPGEVTLSRWLTDLNISHRREFVFHPIRNWRFDFAFPSLKIALEVEGGTQRRRGKPIGRHVTHEGYSEDCCKYNEAAALGWKVYRFTTQQVNDGYAFEFLSAYLLPRLTLTKVV